MTQQIINIGTGPDSYTGDNLRTAFEKVNENFSQLYAGNVGGNLIANTLTANNYSSSGNLTAGNITALYSLVSQGNVSAAYFIGNGSQLTGITANASLGNLIITGVAEQTIEATANAGITLKPFDGRGVVLRLTDTAGANTNLLSMGNFFSNTVLMSATGNLRVQGSNLDIFSTDNLIISANANPGISTSGLISINSSNGHMGFNTYADGYMFAFRGDVFGNAFYAAENFTTGYSFATPGGLTGTSHVYQNDINGNVSLVRITHDNSTPAKFYENNHTILSGNLVVSQNGNVFGSGFPDAFVQVYSNANIYTQLVWQNLNSGPAATGDIVVTSDSGTDTTYYIDIGIAGSGYDNTNPNNSLGTSINPLDGYFYVQGLSGNAGGNLTLGTTVANTQVKILVGGVNAENVVATFDSANATVSSNLVMAGSIYAFTASPAPVIAGFSSISAQTLTASGNLTVGNTYVPTTASSTGTKGQITFDGDYVYICVDTDTWKRANLTSW